MPEFGRSDTAAAHGIDNSIPDAVKPAIRGLVLNLLQPINDATGWRNRISSGYRCKKLNSLLPGSSSTSMHMTGEAADCKFYVPGVKGEVVRWLSSIEVAEQVIAQKLVFDQMILYPTFVHLSFTTKRANRQQVLYNKSYRGPKL